MSLVISVTRWFNSCFLTFVSTFPLATANTSIDIGPDPWHVSRNTRINSRISSSTTAYAPAYYAHNFKFTIIEYDQWTARISLINTNQTVRTFELRFSNKTANEIIFMFNKLLGMNLVSPFQRKPYSM